MTQQKEPTAGILESVQPPQKAVEILTKKLEKMLLDNDHDHKGLFVGYEIFLGNLVVYFASDEGEAGFFVINIEGLPDMINIIHNNNVDLIIFKLVGEEELTIGYDVALRVLGDGLKLVYQRVQQAQAMMKGGTHGNSNIH